MIPAGPHAVHLVRSHDGGDAFAWALAADHADGLESWVILLQGMVEPGADPGGGDVVVPLAADCRRRGHLPPPGALEYDELIDLLASATRVAGW